MFKLTKILDSRINVPEPELLPPTANETFKEGEALVLSGGKLTKATGSTKPTYICMKNYTAPATEAEELPCFRVCGRQVFEVPVYTAGGTVELAVGAKITIGTDGARVTDTTTDGVATIIDTLGASKSGDKILVVFE